MQRTPFPCRRRVWILLLLLWLPLTADAEAAEEGSLLVGACTHFSQGKGDLKANLQAITNAGIASIRDEVPWSAVERQKDVLEMPSRFDEYVRASRRSGLQPLLILDYANPFYDDGDRPRSDEAIEGFCRYAEFVVRHFGKGVRLYEVWNEWDIGIGLPERHRKGGSAEDYLRLLRAVYPRMKAADPGITVMAGACTSGGVKKGWLEKIVQLGALDFCDAISIHSYNHSQPFPGRTPESCSAWMTGVQAMLRRHNQDRDVPFHVTEMGWPTYTGKNGTDPELAGSYLARLFLLARTSPSFHGLWWYDFQDDGWDASEPEHNFGMVRPDLTPKPAYHVLADLAKFVGTARFEQKMAVNDTNIWVLRFRYQDQDVLAIWSGDDEERPVVMQTGSNLPPVIVHQLGHPEHSQEWQQQIFWDHNKFIPLLAGPRPTLLRGDLTSVEVLAVPNLMLPQPTRPQAE